MEAKLEEGERQSVVRYVGQKRLRKRYSSYKLKKKKQKPTQPPLTSCDLLLQGGVLQPAKVKR